MTYIKSWNEAFGLNVNLIGGKGYNLAKLHHYSFPVPEGGILTTEAYESFIKFNNLSHVLNRANNINIDNLTSNETFEILESIQSSIMLGEFPEDITNEIKSFLGQTNLENYPLAVRSSATAEDSTKYSFAGIHETVLNVKGLNDVLEAVKRCFASIWSIRAVGYRRKFGINDSELMPAVVIMRLIEPKCSGIAFTCNPITGEKDQLLIHANFGLGETLVSGEVDPDEYIVRYSGLQTELINVRLGRKEKTLILDSNSRELRLKEQTISTKQQVLTSKEILELSKIILRVFETIGDMIQHQDIEWVFDGKIFYIVQTRPVTIISEKTYPELIDEKIIWSNANFKDVMPNVQSFLSWSIIRDPLEQMVLTPFKLANYPILKGLEHTKIYNGRAYMNLSALQWEMYDAFGIPPRIFNRALGGHQPEIKYPVKEERNIKKKVIRTLRKVITLVKMVRLSKYAERLFKEKIKSADKLRNLNLKSLDNKELLNIFYAYYKELLEYTPQAQVLNTLSGFYFTTLETQLRKKFGDDGITLLNKLLKNQGNITSAQQGYELQLLADIAKQDPEALNLFRLESFESWDCFLSEKSIFKKKFKEYLRKYGHRGIYELDISNPRWREDPNYLLQIIQEYVQNNLKEYTLLNSENSDLLLDEVRGLNKLIINLLLCKTVSGFEKREMAKSVLAHLLECTRKLLLEIADRLVEMNFLKNRNEIFYLGWFEIIGLLNQEWGGSGLETLINHRIKLIEEYENKPYPNIIINDIPKFITQSISNDNNKYSLKGLGVASGKVEGICRIVKHPSEAIHLKKGDILVTNSTDPSWTPLFLKVSGIIMETGGYLSHGAIVAREYGIPAVVNVAGIMNFLKDGQRVTVDGDKGVVLVENVGDKEF
ncbi:pyruvate,water dikinase [Thermolongibacillus altinsuensis]|uniref:Pyruvate,water dikinase n=1 Tax=Thermolongibacillus altinsuensis TaxID=575256 RepID=A0A4R1Q8E0_9BACL|nr:PEP/pyruvate-binding domain-containing protein [Thermolongibacillus altinsuensis]TCL43370.1 pyruvate,water dikinase [Thermolongibacillus altinsuensis]